MTISIDNSAVWRVQDEATSLSPLLRENLSPLNCHGSTQRRTGRNRSTRELESKLAPLLEAF